MKIFAALAVLSLGCAERMNAQGRPIDWPSFAGDARRTGWQRSDTRITRDNIKDFQLVLKRKFENQVEGARALTPPVVIGLLISYRGFKELGFVAGSAGDLWSVDVDVNKIFWHKRLEPSVPKPGSGLCSDGLAAMPALTPPAVFGARRAAPGAPTRTNPPHARVGSAGFGVARPVFVLASDGKLHVLNTSNGSDQFPAISFLPPQAKATTLTMHDQTIYTTTAGNCGGTANGVWAVDLAPETPVVSSFALDKGSTGGIGGVAIGNDGTVYASVANSVLALSPRDLKLNRRITIPDETPEGAPARSSLTTPVVFDYKGRDLVVSAGRDGRLYLLDSQSLEAPLHRTSPLSTESGSADRGIWGGISSWEDAEGVRWVAAPVWGAVSAALDVPLRNGPTPNGAIVAFKVEEQAGKPVLTPAWVSRNMTSPVPPVITSGAVFALSAGGYTRQGGEMRPVKSSRATLYALDAATGKEIYTTGNQVAGPATLTGVTIANGRVFFTTTDGTLYGFGIYMEI